MFEKNGVVYSENHSLQLEVTNIKVLDNMILLLTFNNGIEKLYDCTELLNKPAFQSLKKTFIFQNPKIIDGIVTWDNEKVDIAPETMYANGFDYNKKDVLVA